MNRKPSFKEELPHWNKNNKVFGLDEVGRGSFAGPLVGASVSFDKDFKRSWFKDINDSKLLTHKKRVRLAKLIQKHCICHIEIIELKMINTIGVGKSNILLFKRLIKQAESKSRHTFFLLDGRKILDKSNVKFIVKGDTKSISIAAASIIAKVYRDKLMRSLGKMYKGYNFYRNKGYGTKFHREAIRKYGLSNAHRSSFRLERFLKP